MMINWIWIMINGDTVGVDSDDDNNDKWGVENDKEKKFVERVNDKAKIR